MTKVFESHKELLEWLKGNPEIDYIASAISPLHAANVDAAISKLMSENKVKKGIIIISAHHDAGYIISEQNFFHTEEDGVTFVKLLPEHNSWWKKVTRPLANFFNCCARSGKRNYFYVINPWFPAYTFMVMAKKAFPGRIPVAIIIDEGLGAYLRTNKDMVRIKIGEGKTWRYKVVFTANYINVFIQRKLFEWMLKRNNRYLDWNLLRKRDGQWEINDDIRPYLIDAYEKIFKSLSIKSEKYKDCILFASQPYAESNEMDSLMEINMLSQVRGCIGDTYQVIFKPHPRDKDLERYEELGMINDFENQSAPLEAIVSAEKPKAIISYTSSILVYAKLIWDITGISLIHLLDADKVSNRTIEEFKTFQNAFEKYIYFPQSLEELGDYSGKL